MTARAAVLAYLQQAGLSTPRANAHIDRLLQEHTQGLAEIIRAHADRDDIDYYSPQGLGEAADLIDPPAEAPTDTGTSDRVLCPVCNKPQRVNSDGRVRRHGDADRPCPGSRTPAGPEATS
ncbi:hypothetical protein ACFVSX_32365 [Streptomyces rubiginosohelvolus]|uniref:hypothetical protein n=1 Tax=Streptomyces rubiginosohelvolus TaxID=67362 RepID=UPI0036DDB0F8